MRLHEKPSAPALRPVNGFHLSPVAIVQATGRRPRFGMSADRAAFRVAAGGHRPAQLQCPRHRVRGRPRTADRAVAVGELGRVLAPAADWF
ncbi:hypothetical protein [Streptomyces brasiliscabiei]|uniref:hypothetical protein n=1 Tax=Streptomyces brasiliscabiei TaxID=2736302 RepID=UPI0030141E57